MRLDPTVMRTMNRQDFRVLAAVETGMRSHELVPANLVASIAALRHGGTGKVLSSLLRDKLLSHDQSCGYDGYRVTNAGYDILALHNLKSRGIVAALGDKIGTGKESDVYVAASPDGKQIVLKFHRLGRTSFRAVKNKRDYFMVNANKGAASQPNSWLFLSRISSLKEFTFMKALHQVEYPTPIPLAQNRHVVVMALVRGVPLYQIHTNRVSAEQAESIFQQSTILASRLAQHGLVHCDLNEYNLMVDLSGIQDKIADDNDVAEHYVRHSGMSVTSKGALSAHAPLQKHAVDGTGEFVTEEPPKPAQLLANGEPKPIVTLIDFPQMVSTRHPNAKELYERDCECLKRFFVMKLKCIPEDGWDDVIPQWEDVTKPTENAVPDDQSTCLASRAQLRLDEDLKASGYSDQDAARDMELFYFTDTAVMTKGGLDVPHEHDEEDESDDDWNEINKHSDVADILSFENKKGLGHNVPPVADDVLEGDDSDNIFDDHGHDMLNDEEISVFTAQSRSQAEIIARRRVQQHLDDRKKKGGARNAFRSRNSTKTFFKGKRVYDDQL